jgi:hypothetical protein
MPNDPNFGRTDLFHLVMINNTFHDQVLRRLIESGMGWKNITINGVPWWIPPTWTDTNHKPIRKPLPHDRE